MINEETVNRLLCEKIVNETWSKAAHYKKEIIEVLDKNGPDNARDISLLIIAAEAFIQKETLIEAEDVISFASS